jgi:hypothetical protein
MPRRLYNNAVDPLAFSVGKLHEVCAHASASGAWSAGQGEAGCVCWVRTVLYCAVLCCAVSCCVMQPPPRSPRPPGALNAHTVRAELLLGLKLDLGLLAPPPPPLPHTTTPPPPPSE